MQALKDAEFAEAVVNLSGNPYFKAFLEKIHEFRTNAVEDACQPRGIESDRITTALLGEIRAYTSIINLANDVGLGEPID